jgi:hypothetical protein
MKLLAALFGFVVLAVVFVIWYRVYRSIKGDDGALLSGGRAKPAKTNSLEEFIASYKRGEAVAGTDPAVGLKTPASSGTKAASQPPVRLVAPAAAGTGAPPPSSTSAAGEGFLSGTTKLAYLACKAGLRDHHVFAHVRLSALGREGAIEAPLAAASVDLLICNAALSAVAAIDLIDAASGPADALKSDYLKTLGIRYLRLSAKSLPRPGDWHALLYKL